jgi:hypothetical protein
MVWIANRYLSFNESFIISATLMKCVYELFLFLKGSIRKYALPEPTTWYLGAKLKHKFEIKLDFLQFFSTFAILWL